MLLLQSEPVQYVDDVDALQLSPVERPHGDWTRSGFLEHHVAPFARRAPPAVAVKEAFNVGKVGWATFGEQYEGPPGKVHGGFVAAAFDDVLGMAQSLGGRPGMTGRLTIRYRAPHPLHTRIRYEAKLESVDGRKTLVTGASYDGETLLAEAEGLFIAVDFTKLLPPSA